MRRIRTIAVFPTMFTLGNLICGFFAIVVAARVESPTARQDAPHSAAVKSAPDIAFRTPGIAVKQFDPKDDTHNCMLSGWLIFLAMIFDALDGHVARLSKTNSDFGAQLDSLCDLVTFGVAPGFLLVKMCPQFTLVHRETVWIIAAAYAACAALRLARFNVETGDEDDHLHFSGLPSPAAAASVAGFAILFYELRREGNQLSYAASIDQVVQYILPGFAVIIALLMVSRIPYPHVVNQMFRGQRGMGHVVGLLFALGAIMSIKGYSLPIICAAFVLIPPVVYAWKRVRAEKPQHEPIF
jgi:CDP-diacylglycerol---serine O-phosphatidyltransferase